MEYLLSGVAFVVGAVAGRLVNVLIEIEADKGAFRPQVLMETGVPLFGPLYNVARKTGAVAPLAVEAISALGLAILTGWLGVSTRLAVFGACFLLFLAVGAYDARTKLIPNRWVYPAIPAAMLLFSFYRATTQVTPLSALALTLLGGIVSSLFLAVPATLMSKGMGWGDVKYAAVIGLVTGFPGALAAVGIAAVGAGIFAIVLLACSMRRRRDSIPFGPFLSAGAMFAMIWGKSIFDWYAALGPR